MFILLMERVHAAVVCLLLKFCRWRQSTCQVIIPMHNIVHPTMASRSLPISPPVHAYEFLPRPRHNTLTCRQPVFKLYLLTRPHAFRYGNQKTTTPLRLECTISDLLVNVYVVSTGQTSLPTYHGCLGLRGDWLLA